MRTDILKIKSTQNAQRVFILTLQKRYSKISTTTGYSNFTTFTNMKLNH